MKKVIFITIYLVYCLAAFCQNKPTSSSDNFIDELNRKIDILENKINEIEIQKNQLDKNIDTLNGIAQSLNSIQSLLFTILPIVISVILTVLMYLLGIKPAKEAAEKLKKDFQTFLHENEIKQMDQAIENIFNDDPFIDSYAYNYLSNYRAFEFSEDQLLRISINIDTKNIQRIEGFKGLLLQILSRKKSKAGDIYFRNHPELLDDYGIKYYITAGIDNYTKDIINLLKSSGRNDSFISLLSSMNHHIDISYALFLINNKQIIEALPKEMIIVTVKCGYEKHDWVKDPKNDFDKSELYKRYLRVKE